MKRNHQVLLPEIIAGADRDSVFSGNRGKFEFRSWIADFQGHEASLNELEVKGQRSDCRSKTSDGFTSAI